MGVVVGSWLVGGGTLSACSRAAAALDDDVHIGFVSGDAQGLAARSEMERNCMLLAVEGLNASGGLGGHTVRMVEAGGRSASERVVQLFEDQHVDVVIGTLAESDRAAAASEVARSGGLLIDAALQATAPCGPGLMTTGLVPGQQVEPMVDWVVANVGRRVLVVGGADAWSRSAAVAVRRALHRHGHAPLAMRTVRDSAELDTTVADAQGANPDVLWSLLQGSDAARLATQLSRQGLRALVVASRWDEMDATANPGLLTGALTSQSWLMSLDTPESRDYVARYQHRFGSGRPVSATGQAISDAVELYAAAVRHAGSTLPAHVAKALPHVEVQTARGPLHMDAGSHVAIGDVYVGQVSGGGTITAHDRLKRPASLAAGCPSR